MYLVNPNLLKLGNTALTACQLVVDRVTSPLLQTRPAAQRIVWGVCDTRTKVIRSHDWRTYDAHGYTGHMCIGQIVKPDRAYVYRTDSEARKKYRHTVYWDIYSQSHNRTGIINLILISTI